MEKVVDYYFTPISGYAYLGHQMLLDVAYRGNTLVRYCPMDITKVFSASDTTPPAKQSVARKSYRQQDMVRLAMQRALPFNESPKFWPAPGGLASKVIIASAQFKLDQSVITGLVLKAVWALDINIADESALRSLLNDAGLPGDDLIDACKQTPVEEEFEQITLTAIEKGVFGSPTYIYDNERYWGQDRLPLLEMALSK